MIIIIRQYAKTTTTNSYYTGSMKKPPFEEIEHTADLALRVRGADYVDLLRNAALGMLQLSGVRPCAGPILKRTIEIQATDRESLLVAWLEELLFVIETREMTFTSFDLHIKNGLQLSANVQETPIETLMKHIKAVTFHDLKISQSEDGLEVTIVFDV